MTKLERVIKELLEKNPWRRIWTENYVMPSGKKVRKSDNAKKTNKT